MVDDQENQFDMLLQDSKKLPPFGSWETSVSEDTAASGRLWIELKIPKSHDHDQSPIGKEPSRICNVCNKGFGSGKALGGHMRIHVQPKKHHLTNLSNTINVGGGSPMNNSKPSCSLCGKNFPSMKSLFGHMRCHPERDWRGIQPPSTVKNSSSSTLSDAIARKTDDHIDSASTAVVSVVDLPRSLSGWSTTARRGQKSMAAASNGGGGGLGSDEQISDVAYNLMMLAQGHGDTSFNSGQSHTQRVDVSEATNSNFLSKKARIEDKSQVSECVAPSKKRPIELSPIGKRRNSPGKKLKIYERDQSTDYHVGNCSSEILLKKMERGKGKALSKTDQFLLEKPVIMNSGVENIADSPKDNHIEESYSKDTNESLPKEELKMSTTTKKTRKVKLKNLAAVGSAIAPPVLDQIHKQIPVTPGKYKCSTCNKSFPTHQALGGHRSSHTKVKNSHTMDESAYASIPENEHYAEYPTAQVDELIEECEEAASSRVLATPHQCKICNKTFPNGQALGGHKRCHWTGPVEAVSSQVASPGEASQTGGRILSFDLNELPAMENEEGIESA